MPGFPEPKIEATARVSIGKTKPLFSPPRSPTSYPLLPLVPARGVAPPACPGPRLARAGPALVAALASSHRPLALLAGERAAEEGTDTNATLKAALLRVENG
jgi:hypothetical protein